MSILDDLCDVCGCYVDPIGGDLALASAGTRRLWCGCCNTGLRSDITNWLYNEKMTLKTVQKTDTHVQESVQVLPIHRPDWDTYYLGIAKAVSARGDCARRQHGAIVVKDHKIVSTGYNGTPPGSPNSCGKTGQCPRNLDPKSKHGEGSYDLCWATHAESNALLRADWSDLQGATIYITGPACPGCSKLIQSAGITRVVTL